MTVSARHVLLRVSFVLAACVTGFLLFQEPARELESQAVASLLQLMGSDHAQVVLGTNVAILADGQWLLATITPSCSTLASVLALGCLALVAPIGRRRRRTLAMACTLAVIIAGNLVRMALSLGFGEIAGRDALLLFHDWIGGLFTFTYTLLGFVLFVYLMLPARRDVLVA